MPIESITNFDSYVWGALGLFILGLFGAMIYEKSSSSAKQYQQQPETASSRQR